MRRWIPFLVAGLVLAACDGGADGVTTTTTPTSVPTTAPATVPPAPTEAGAAYFLAPGGENPGRPGPFILPVHRELPAGDPGAAVTALLAGPSAGEMEAGIGTAVPAGTELLAIDIADGIATVDVTGTFDDGGGSFSMFARLAQLVYTVTRYEGVDGVLLRLDGVDVEVFSSEGLILDRPMSRELTVPTEPNIPPFADLLPGILVDRPAWGEPVSGPFTVSGLAAAFEGVFQMELLDSDGATIVAPPFVQASTGVGWGTFSVELDPGAATGPVRLRVWELSAESGDVVSERIYPLTLEE
jgi:hypothetical protein